MWRLTMAGIRLILILSTSQIAVLVGGRIVNAGNDSDPLAPYAEMMPGDRAEVLDSYPCVSQVVSLGEMLKFCNFRLNESPLLLQSLSTYEFAIQQLTFRASGLYVGDLARYWGRPIIENDEGTDFARWYRDEYRIGIRIEEGEQFSYWLPVRFLYVEENHTDGS